ncbi:hypothetical protein QEN19_001715 [Hanseniaspora menglaensis]
MDIFSVLTRGTNIRPPSGANNQYKVTKKISSEENKELDFFNNQNKKATEDIKNEIVEEEIVDDDISMKDLLVKNHVNGKLIYNIDNFLLSVDKPTEIQHKSIPYAIENDETSIIGISPTGTGKTLAFIVPLISKIIANTNNKNLNSVQGIIIAPTNDLAKQILQVTENLAQGILLNHKNSQKNGNQKQNTTKLDVQSLSTKLTNKLQLQENNVKLPQILVCTPKRLLSVISDNDTSLIEHLKFFIIDEFDQLFSKDFIKQTEKLLKLIGSKKQINKWFFSATKPEEELLGDIMKKHMNQPEIIECKYSSKLTSNIIKPKITESLVFVGNEQGKLLQLRQLQQTAKFIPPMLIFLESYSRCIALYNELKYNSIPMATLHSKQTLNEREAIINDFKMGKTWVIITTDIMARGLDINGVRTVINYDIPKTKEWYIHRLGRLGRGLTSYNQKGRKQIECQCITLYSKIDVKDVVPIAKVIKQHGGEGVPDWLYEGRIRQEKKVKNSDSKLKREKISTVPGIVRKERRMKKEMIEASKKRKLNEDGKSKKVVEDADE